MQTFQEYINKRLNELDLSTPANSSTAQTKPMPPLVQQAISGALQKALPAGIDPKDAFKKPDVQKQILGQLSMDPKMRNYAQWLNADTLTQMISGPTTH